MGTTLDHTFGKNDQIAATWASSLNYDIHTILTSLGGGGQWWWTVTARSKRYDKAHSFSPLWSLSILARFLPKKQLPTLQSLRRHMTGWSTKSYDYYLFTHKEFSPVLSGMKGANDSSNQSSSEDNTKIIMQAVSYLGINSYQLGVATYVL